MECKQYDVLRSHYDSTHLETAPSNGVGHHMHFISGIENAPALPFATSARASSRVEQREGLQSVTHELLDSWRISTGRVEYLC
jgi:hypothetical protein